MQKIAALLFMMLIVTAFSYAQDGKIGLFRNLNVKTGLSLTGFYSLQGEYIYTLQQNARVVEESEKHAGAALSIVILFPLNDDEKWNLLLNLSFVDFKGNTPEKVSLFNSETPFGVGGAWFPFKKPTYVGFVLMTNIGWQKRMRPSAIKEKFYPIADYPNYQLAVGDPVPEAILGKSLKNSATVAFNGGIIIRL